jgi:formylglycine-generating enzyme required for sulfatase activity
VTLTLASNRGNLAKAGYAFGGWNTAANGTGTDYAAGGSYTANASVTLYAKWVAAYSVTYNPNGATGGTAPAPQTKPHGVALTLRTNSGNLAKTGYGFARWNTAANGTGTDYAAGVSYTANASVTLYAKWIAQLALTFRPSGWVYINWPWAFESSSGDWHWFKTDDTQWVNGFSPADGWRKMPQSALASGWSFYQLPFAFCAANNAWYYINEVDTQWVVNMRTGAWSRFGQPTIPTGMVLIHGGTNAGMDPDFGAYSLTVPSFYMDKYEVTKARWDEVKNWNGGNGYSYDNVGSGKAVNHPVHAVNWYDCVKWCNARSEAEGREAAYYTDAGFTQTYKTGRANNVFVKVAANGYRLPTDLQWEYAARGGVPSRRFPWGDTITHSQANYYSSWSGDAPRYAYDDATTQGYHPTYATGGSPYTSPVGSFGANGYGLYDMAGNVYEWCFDWYPGYGYEGSYRVYRGSSWGSDADYCRVAYRSGYNPDSGWNYVGFRACLPPGQQ